MARPQLIDSIREAAFLVGGTRRDYDALLEAAQGVRFVLLGEATHGSHELYRERARNAEVYYRSMFGSRISTWNLRDRHMHETLEAIASWLFRRDGYARVVVWAHNSHLGDARATEMAEEAELNVGQLVRERHGEEALLVGFTTCEGTVTAADGWGDPPLRMSVRPALAGSVEELFHDVALPRFFLPLRGAGEALGQLREPMLERAIGVVYRPRTERYSHYFQARLAAQFDAVVHVDRTRAVEPLERSQVWTAEPPETYPSAL